MLSRRCRGSWRGFPLPFPIGVLVNGMCNSQSKSQAKESLDLDPGPWNCKLEPRSSRPARSSQTPNFGVWAWILDPCSSVLHGCNVQLYNGRFRFSFVLILVFVKSQVGYRSVLGPFFSLFLFPSSPFLILVTCTQNLKRYQIRYQANICAMMDDGKMVVNLTTYQLIGYGIGTCRTILVVHCLQSTCTDLITNHALHSYYQVRSTEYSVYPFT